jgi:hypothetical protein
MNYHDIKTNRPEKRGEVSGNQRRLLDMLAGHAAYLESSIKNSNDILARDGTYDEESDYLARLYAKVGNADSISDSDLLTIMTREVIPFLLNGVIK